MTKTKKKSKGKPRSNSAAQIKSSIERIERLAEEKDAVAADIREIYAEAKSNGFDVKTIRRIVRERKQDAAERAEQEAIYETYAHQLGHGEFADTSEEDDNED